MTKSTMNTLVPAAAPSTYPVTDLLSTATMANAKLSVPRDFEKALKVIKYLL